jgi:hypothetical protein
MSTKSKFYTCLSCLLLIMSSNSFGQVGTMEMVLSNFAPGLGPTVNPVGPISMRRDNNNQTSSNNNLFDNPSAAQATSVTMALSNQQYTGLTYSNISTGLVFGAQPTTAFDPSNTPGIQRVDPLDIYNLLGSFNINPGGPTNNMFTSLPNGTAGTGMIVDGTLPGNSNDDNGAVSVFTNTQLLFDQAGGPATYNSATRYYYGDLTITFSRYVDHPVIHIAGLGGSYRFVTTTANQPVSGMPAGSTVWTYFTTELQAQTAYTLTQLSGNAFFNVSGTNILNSATQPNGASAHTSAPDLYGAASGSFQINGVLRAITFKVYLRGSDVANSFKWSANQSDIAGSNRNPLTGDYWWVSATAGLPQLIPLPVTGLNLTANLNNSNVTLDWKTYTEMNSKQFVIERSTDGANFTAIGTKAAAGYSNSTLDYGFLDANMNVPVYYYRIRIEDIDGKVSYSNIAVVKNPGSVKGVHLYPNPAQSQSGLELDNLKGKYSIMMFNQSGQQVYTKDIVVNNTVQYETLSRNSLPAGVYVVKVSSTTGSEQYIQKVTFE